MTSLYRLLMWFKALLGLKINLEKNKFILITRVDNVEVLTTKLGCKVGRFLPPELGMPLGTYVKAMEEWDEIEDKFKKYILSLWKRHYISKGTRITLIFFIRKRESH